MWLARGNTSRQHREIGLYKVTLDPKLPKYIQILDIFGSAKIQPDVVQPPGSRKITVGDAGAVDLVEFSGSKRTELYSYVILEAIATVQGTGVTWRIIASQHSMDKSKTWLFSFFKINYLVKLGASAPFLFPFL